MRERERSREKRLSFIHVASNQVKETINSSYSDDDSCIGNEATNLSSYGLLTLILIVCVVSMLT